MGILLCDTGACGTRSHEIGAQGTRSLDIRAIGTRSCDKGTKIPDHVTWGHIVPDM